MIEIKAPVRSGVDFLCRRRVFLAGSVDMGKAENWQEKLTRILSDVKDVAVYNPRRDDWDSSWVQDISNAHFREQVEWELEHMDKANVIVYVFDPKGQAPITLMELGLHARDANESKYLLVCCPEGYWRRGNVQVICHEYGIPLFNSLEELVPELLKKVGYYHG